MMNDRVPTDQILRRFNALWYDNGLWPTEDNAALSFGVQRFYTIRRQWAQENGLAHPDPYQIRQQARLARQNLLMVKAPKPRRPRNELQMIAHILKRIDNHD